MNHDLVKLIENGNGHFING